MPYFVYVVRSKKDGRLYIGSTDNVARRLREHNRGKTRSLRHRRPLEVIYVEEFINADDGRRREKQLKSFNGGEALRRLLAGGVPERLNGPASKAGRL